MSVPAGFGAAGMPVGLQLIGNYFARRHAAARGARLPAGDRLAPAHAAVAEAAAMSGECSAPRALIRGYEVVIGIETHAQLSTRSKIFSGASTAFGAAPNTQASAGRPRAARHAAGDEPRRGRARDPLRPGGRRDDRAALDLRAQELLLSRPAQGLPDQPVRDAGGAGRRGRVLRRRRRASRPADARPPRGGRRQVAARRRSDGERRRGAPPTSTATGRAST